MQYKNRVARRNKGGFPWILPSVAKPVEQVYLCAEGIHFEGDLDSETLRIKCLSFTAEF